MAVKTIFSKQDFDRILSEYDLGAYTRSASIPQGTVQTNYFIHTTQGEFVLRYYENRSMESVLFESDLLAYLKLHAYPCPTPFQNKRGDCVGIYQGKPYVMFEFIHGKPIEHPNDNHKEQLIRKVAELQILTKDYRPLNTEYRWNYNPELCRRLARAEANTIDTQDARKKYVWAADQISALDLPEYLPKGICHCDFHFSNVLFQDDRLVGLLDFDDANYTYLVFDLVCLIDSWAWPFQSDRPDFAQAREIVKAYNSYRPLSEIELRHIYDVHKLSILFDCIWFFRRGPAENFYEKRKIQFLSDLGWRKYFETLFPV